MIYGLALYKEKMLTIMKHIPKTEYDRITNIGNSFQSYSKMNQLFEMCKENIDEYLKLLSDFRNDNLHPAEVSNKANRYLVNTLTSFNILIEHCLREVSKVNDKEKDNIRKLTSKLYDSYFSYRFLTRLRNYVVHFGFPIHIITANMNGEKDFLGKVDQLLLDKSWSTVAREIEEMRPKVSYEKYVLELSDTILPVLRDRIFLALFPTYIEDIENLTQIIKIYIDPVTLISANSENDIMRGEINMHLLPYTAYQKIITEAQSSPYINLKQIQ